MSIDATLTQEVMAPWHELCRSSTHPWMATPELRTKWYKMAQSKDATTAFVGAFGLCRAAELTYAERLEVEKYFFTYDGRIVSHNVTILAMLTGASLAHAYCQLSLQARFGGGETEPKKERALISLMCNYLRHPDSAHLPILDILSNSEMQAYRYAITANPMKPAPDGAVDDWNIALRIFKGGSEVNSKDGDFFQFANLLRITHDSNYIKRQIKASLLIQPYISVIETHPGITREPCPEFSHTNPTNQAIQYFSATNNPFCAIWRFYNPLLIPPWIMNSVSSKHNAGVFAGFALLGAPPNDVDNISGKCFPDLSSRLKTHPAQQILAYFPTNA